MDVSLLCRVLPGRAPQKRVYKSVTANNSLGLPIILFQEGGRIRFYGFVFRPKNETRQNTVTTMCILWGQLAKSPLHSTRGYIFYSQSKDWILWNINSIGISCTRQRRLASTNGASSSAQQTMLIESINSPILIISSSNFSFNNKIKKYPQKE